MEINLDDPLSSCLLYIADSHGIATSRDALLDGLPLVDNKLTPALIKRAAKRIGINANVMHKSLNRVNESLLPCILLQNNNSACLLEKVDLSAKKALIRIPELGMELQEIPLEELNANFIGTAIFCSLEFKVNSAKETEDKTRNNKHWFWGVIFANRRVYRDVLIAALFINILAMTMPLFVMNVYDRVVPNFATDTLWALAVGAFTIVCADLALRVLRSWFVELAAQRADTIMSADIMEHILGMRMEKAPGSIGSFASNVQSFESVRSFIGSMIVVSLIDLPFFLLFILIISIISVYMAIPVLVGAIVVLIYALSVHGRMKELADLSSKASSQRNSGLIESLSTAQTLKSFNATGRMQALWEQATVYLSGCSGKQRLLGGSVGVAASWVQQTVAILMIIIGVYEIINGNMSQGALIAAYMLSSRALAPVSQVASLLTQYHQAATALDSLQTIMENEQERDTEKQIVSHSVIRGDIEFKGVSFTYPEEKTPALNNVSFTIKAGEHVAILGQTGSGKSTIEKLILGLYKPTEGSIFIDGIHIEQLDISEVRQAIGYIPQDIELLNGSIYDNITLGVRTPQKSAILDAVKMSGLSRLVGDHADGLGMPVGEAGRKLSGGQRQGIAVARSIVQERSIYLFDEPTSAMDSVMENHVGNALSKTTKGKTLLLITHRTILLHLVERLIILDGSRVVADGKKEVVLKALEKGTVQRSKG